MRPKAEAFARELDAGTVSAVRSASAIKVTSRTNALTAAFVDPEEARADAQAIKDFVLDNLKDLLLQFEARATANGIRVHWASDAESARQVIREICASVLQTGSPTPSNEMPSLEAGKPLVIVKGKSMATEEIHLNRALEEAGHKVVETDLGEFVVQIDGDTPSHIVTPIIHKDRQQVAQSFQREHLGPYTEEPVELAAQARAHLRSKFQEASIGISGVNFALAQEGAIAILENEGNNRLSTTAPDLHIAVMGIEKLLPSMASLPLFVRLLAGSATGQRTTVYTHLVKGPRRDDETDGPSAVHVVLLDNGRSRVMSSRYRSILRCIRCGACLNVCPVYRRISGHGYRNTYSGPLGAVLAPALEGVEAIGDLAKASSLCGACEEVCPVRIPIPDMLLRLREEGTRKGAISDGIPWGAYTATATSSGRWRAGLFLLPMAGGGPSGWMEYREAPRVEGRSFRSWWAKR